MTLSECGLYVALTASVLSTPLPWLLSLEWTEFLRWYTRALAAWRLLKRA